MSYAVGYKTEWWIWWIYNTFDKRFLIQTVDRIEQKTSWFFESSDCMKRWIVISASESRTFVKFNLIIELRMIDIFEWWEAKDFYENIQPAATENI